MTDEGHTQHMQTLRAMLDADGLLSDTEWADLAAIWHPFSGPRRSVLTSQGQVEGHLYFVTDGLQRVCHYGPDGREATLVFTFAPSFGGVLDSFLLGHASAFTYETLTASSFYRARSEDLRALMHRHPAIARMMLTGVTRALSGVMERMAELQTMTSEEKFRRLLTRSPHILRIVPHRHLANYIGIDPTNFSKLLNSVKI